MRKEISFVIVGILLLGVVNASLVSFLSNVVTGEVEVKGPVFYLDATKDSQYDKYYTLKLNDDDVLEGELTLSDGGRIWFVSDVLGVDDFYDEKYEIELELEAINGNESLPGSIYAELYIGCNDNDVVEKICETTWYTSVKRTKDVYTLDCIPDSNKGLKNIEDDEKIMLALSTSPTNIDIKVYTESDSKVEVEAK